MKYKKRPQLKDDSAPLGQDSFLDLVSNIVGILIILVMIAGIRASSSESLEAEKQSTELTEELNVKTVAAGQLRYDIDEIKIKKEIVAEQISKQSGQYAELFDKMTSIRAAIDITAEEQGQNVKEQVEFQRQLMETNVKIAEMEKTKSYLEQMRPKATVVENIPTPLAQTVEDKEVHFRLLNGKVAYVPWIELMTQLRAEISDNRERYFRQKVSAGKLGPTDNFTLEFMMGVFDVPAREGLGKMISLQYAEMTPDSQPFGEELKRALHAPSRFLRKLSMFRRDIYTVTVWVYPDSFEEYQELKKYLFEQGYKVAARPLMMGETISGSPRGTKSSAQ
ncbi:hypothetical protein FACS189419_01090 [Planctomycetales bacterium]|nr:hypothetical protein FACS189419_01090 [Planctomycetales bacterium]